MAKNFNSTSPLVSGSRPWIVGFYRSRRQLPTSYQILLRVAFLFGSFTSLILLLLVLFVALPISGVPLAGKTSVPFNYKIFEAIIWTILIYGLVIFVTLHILIVIELFYNKAKLFVPIVVLLWMSCLLLNWLVAILMLTISLRKLREQGYMQPKTKPQPDQDLKAHPNDTGSSY